MSPLPMSSNVSALPLVLALIWLWYLISSIMYNVHFHPRHKYAGPKLGAASPVVRYIATTGGALDHQRAICAVSMAQSCDSHRMSSRS
jgi:hypothetical protein